MMGTMRRADNVRALSHTTNPPEHSPGEEGFGGVKVTLRTRRAGTRSRESPAVAHQAGGLTRPAKSRSRNVESSRFALLHKKKPGVCPGTSGASRWRRSKADAAPPLEKGVGCKRTALAATSLGEPALTLAPASPRTPSTDWNGAFSSQTLPATGPGSLTNGKSLGA